MMASLGAGVFKTSPQRGHHDASGWQQGHIDQVGPITFQGRPVPDWLGDSDLHHFPDFSQGQIYQQQMDQMTVMSHRQRNPRIWNSGHHQRHRHFTSRPNFYGHHFTAPPTNDVITSSGDVMSPTSSSLMGGQWSTWQNGGINGGVSRPNFQEWSRHQFNDNRASAPNVAPSSIKGQDQQQSQCQRVCDAESFCSSSARQPEEEGSSHSNRRTAHHHYDVIDNNAPLEQHDDVISADHNSASDSTASDSVARMKRRKSSGMRLEHALELAKTVQDQGVFAVAPLLLKALKIDPQSEDGQQIQDSFSPHLRGLGDEEDEAVVAAPAGCVPEDKLIDLRQNFPGVDVDIFPHCTRARRCGGCCSHDLLECQPTQIETSTLSVFKWTYYHDGEIVYDGKQQVQVQNHLNCTCGCKVKPEDCNSRQEYNRDRCSCDCKREYEAECFRRRRRQQNSDAAAVLNHIWDPTTCTCKCRNSRVNAFCSTGLLFDNNTCSCTRAAWQQKYRQQVTEDESEETVSEWESNQGQPTLPEDDMTGRPPRQFHNRRIGG